MVRQVMVFEKSAKSGIMRFFGTCLSTVSEFARDKKCLGPERTRGC